jgi:hypothetical protein
MLNECHNAECHYAECHYAECHYAECHYAEYRYAECHYAECHYAECRGTFLETPVIYDRKLFAILVTDMTIIYASNVKDPML